MKAERNGKSKKAGTRRIAAAFLTVLALGAMLATTSYAWIKRQWTPSVYGDGIRIEAGSALAFRMNSEGAKAQTSVSLTGELGADFVLSPVSNCSGESRDFFTLDRSAESQADYRYRHVEQVGSAGTRDGWTKAGIKNGYIEISFSVLGRDDKADDGLNNYLKYVYLDGGSYLRSSAGQGGIDCAEAIRISLTVDEAGTAEAPLSGRSASGGRTVILGTGERDFEALTNQTFEENGETRWLADGVKYYQDAGPGSETPLIPRTFAAGNVPLRKTVRMQDFSAYDGGITAKDGARFADPEKCLTVIQPGQCKTITARVWLEGCDPLCSDDIAGLKLDLLLSFSALNCEISPETVDGREMHRVMEPSADETE